MNSLSRISGHAGNLATLAAIHDPIDLADSYLVSKALPIQYDVMRAPKLPASRAPVLRPGALDYQRYASHGDRC